MTLISHDSALEYWRQMGSLASTAEEQREATAKARVVFASAPAVVPDESTCYQVGLSQPIHVLVSRRSRTTAKCICQHQAAFVPSRSFVRIRRGMLVSTPEFVFFQMASRLSLVQLICLGCELCGLYALLPDQTAVSRDHQLTTTHDIAVFLDGVHDLTGIKRAKRALRYVIDKSASPMETVLALNLSLPCLIGGYGLPKPEMNYELRLNPAQRASARRSACVCDLYWPDSRLCVEYDSDMFHTGADRIARDAARRNALADMGVDEITVTKRQLFDDREFNGVAHQIARKLGKRLRYDDVKFIRKFTALRQELLMGFESDGRK